MSSPTGSHVVPGARLDIARALLFVPGDRPERFAKAAAAGADLVVIDLEDATAPEAKDDARAHVVAYLDTAPRPASVAVRINAADTPWHDADVAALTGRDVAVMLPKAEAGAALGALAATGLPVVALVETAAGILDAREIAATPGVRRLALGPFDLASELGVDPADRDALRTARSLVVLASVAAGLAGPIDAPHAAIGDDAGLLDATLHARRLGFAGKLCIHPSQVAGVLDAFRPSDEDVAWALEILAAMQGREGVAQVDGAMVDKPVVDRARRILADVEGRV